MIYISNYNGAAIQVIMRIKEMAQGPSGPFHMLSFRFHSWRPNGCGDPTGSELAASSTDPPRERSHRCSKAASTGRIISGKSTEPYRTTAPS